MSTGRFALLVVVLAAAPAARADEAVRRDGTRINGTLALADGRFAFRTAGRDEPIAGLEFIRFAPKSPADPAVALWHLVRVGRDEVFLAEVRKLDPTHLHVRPAWAATLAVPRAAIERVGHAPGRRAVFFDTFDGDLAAWARTRDPRTRGGHLILSAAGQAVEAKLQRPLTAGRIGISFRSAVTRARTVELELAFERDGKPSIVRVEFVGPAGPYRVTSPGRPDRDGRLKREPGPHRLMAEFDADGIHVFLDRLVMWAQPTGPGRLVAVRLTAGGSGDESAEVDDILVERLESPTDPRPWADLTADAVRLPDGDETFGSLATAGPNGLVLEVKGRALALPWPDVSEFAFGRGPVSERPTAGEHVRVRVRTADGLHDELEGAVRGFDDKVLVLAHAVLGDLAIPRDRLDELRLLFRGRRVPVDTTPHHLGARPAFGFAVPKPDGIRLVRTSAVDTVPADGFVVVDAARLGATGTPLEVLVNGERINDLNRLADRAGPAVRAYRLPVPASAWRRGENEIELRLRPVDGRRVTGVDLRSVRLELHDPR